MFPPAIVFTLAIMSAAVVADAQPQDQSLNSKLDSPTLVDIGNGRRLNFFCLGRGSPTVIFEQGGEGDIANWKSVQPAISAITRTCFYDRAGFGHSDAPTSPVTGLNVTDDLHALLRKEDIKGPLVFVGHSIGGFYATLYADRFTSEVAGLVLIEPGFSGQQQWRTAEDRKLNQASILRGENRLLECAALARNEKLTEDTVEINNCFSIPKDSSPSDIKHKLYSATRPAWYEAEYSQSLNFFSRDEGLSVSQAQEVEAKRRFGEIPMIVLSAATPPKSVGVSEEASDRSGRHWQTGHQELAKRSTRGRWVVVQNAGHFIQRDQPQAVITAIEQVVTEVRAGSR